MNGGNARLNIWNYVYVTFKQHKGWLSNSTIITVITVSAINSGSRGRFIYVIHDYDMIIVKRIRELQRFPCKAGPGHQFNVLLASQ